MTPFTLAGEGPNSSTRPVARLLHAGLLCGLVDGIWAVVLTLAREGSVAALFHGITAIVFGPETFEPGTASVLLGIGIHVGVAFLWSAVFLALLSRSAWLRSRLVAPAGMLGIAAIYGPLIWVVMSAAVIPLRTGQPVSVTPGWWIQLAGHAAFVGLPIVGSFAWHERRDRGGGASVTG